jgi:predicted transcriptional regulator
VSLTFWKSNAEKTMVLQPTVNETIGLLKVSDRKLDETSCFSTFYSQQRWKHNGFIEFVFPNLMKPSVF